MISPFRMRSRSTGFSLVELLIVVTVIAVLAAVIIPTLSMSRKKGRETSCINNLRQIGQGFGMYQQDNEGLRPPFIHNLYPNYISSKSLFICPNDAWTEKGGYAWDMWGKDTTSIHHWPFPVSYIYPWSSITKWDSEADNEWTYARSLPNRAGYLVCLLHGQPIKDDDPPQYAGATLRLCFDGSVVQREIVYKKPRTFSAWQIVTDQEHYPDELMRKTITPSDALQSK